MRMGDFEDIVNDVEEIVYALMGGFLGLLLFLTSPLWFFPYQIYKARRLKKLCDDFDDYVNRTR